MVNALGFEDVMKSDFPTLNGMLTCRPVKMIIYGDITNWIRLSIFAIDSSLVSG